MADRFDCVNSNLLCEENTNTCFDDDLGCNNATDELGVSSPLMPQQPKKGIHDQEPSFDLDRSKPLMSFPLQSEEIVRTMVVRESEHLPRADYLKRLRSGDLDLSVRREALDWIWKAQAHYSFGPMCVCLAMNYLDRFLSLYELPRGKAWTVQLLAVACLSLAAKMDETKVPQSVDLQVGDPKFLFEAITIQRMELLVLSTLKWRLQTSTPCSFVDYFLSKISDDQFPSMSSLCQSAQLILGTIRGIDFLEFKPSEIAAAVAISVSGEIKAVDIDRAICSFTHVHKGRVLKCLELIKDLSLISRCTNGVSGSASAPSSVPQSPVGVLDAATCLSYKSDELTVGSCANSSLSLDIISSPDTKRRKSGDALSDVGFKS
ncbi:cyclin-D4-2-like [Humulus lupulus]|uniref:cyclin-D4-2-like n=1 Tax=Humulus lupulus TaxID=3486 RepID=UPI002B40752B|nr:cyclin-D4-2-like [Humulus lupulus]